MPTDNRTKEPNQNETKSGQAFCFTEAQVLAAAKAIYGDDPAWGYVSDYGGGEVASQWRHLGEGIQEMFRLKARAALVATQGAAPVQPSSTVDEDWLTDVIWARATRKTSLGFSINSREGAAMIARAVVEAIGGEGR